MTDPPDLYDIDTDPDWDNVVYLILEARYPDGMMSTYTHEIANSDDIATVTESIIGDDMERRGATSSPNYPSRSPSPRSWSRRTMQVTPHRS